MASLIGALRVTLGLDTAAFEKGATRAELRAKALGNNAEALGMKVGRMGKVLAAAGGAFLGSAVVSELRSMARAGLEYASTLGETAQQLGVSVTALQQYRFIASQVGIDQDVMDKGLSKLSINLGKLATGSAPAAAALAKFGFNQAEVGRLSKMTAEQALPFLADKFTALKSPTEQAAFAAELFSAKIGGKFVTLLNLGGGAIQAFIEDYKRMGIAITPEQAKKADKAIDDQEKLKTRILGMQAQLSTDHAEMILKYETGWQKFKIGAMQAAVDFGKWVDKMDADISRAGRSFQAFVKQSEADWAEYGAKFRKNMGDTAGGFADVGKWALGLKISIATAFGEAVKWAQKLHDGVKLWLQDKLGATFKWVADKLGLVGDAFFNLYDRTVGHSYIPDMVDGIALHMARLDGVMVDPALSATERTTQAFKQLQDDVQGIMGELFPDARDLADFRGKLDKLNQGIKDGGAGGYSADQLQAGRDRLIDGATSDQLANGGVALADRLAAFGSPADSMRDIVAQLEKLGPAANDNADDVQSANVRVIKSFKDMADATLQSLTNLTGAIKGGGFLDILGAVIGLGLQLGSIGAFGKGIQKNINTPKAFAKGTNFAPGGLALVGERGPELVNLPRGSKVWPNGTGPGGGGNTYNFSGNLLTPEFWAQIQAGDAQAAQAGAMGGQARVAFANSRRLA